VRTASLRACDSRGLIWSVISSNLIHFSSSRGSPLRRKLFNVEAIQHDLIAHGFDGANAVQGLPASSRAALSSTRRDIHDEQQRQNGQDQAETGVKFFSDRSSRNASVTSAGGVEMTASAEQLFSLFPLHWHETQIQQPACSLRAQAQLPFLHGVLAGLNEQGVSPTTRVLFTRPPA